MRITAVLVVVACVACPGSGEVGADAGTSTLRLALDHSARAVCTCADGTPLTACVADCDAAVDCNSACAAHLGVIEQHCVSGDVECLLADTAAGGNGVVCSCGDAELGPVVADRGACTTLDCDADAAVVDAVCAAACGDDGVNGVQARCVAADDGCASFDVPTGRDLTRCACGDGSSPVMCTTGICNGALRSPTVVCAAVCGGEASSTFGLAQCTPFDVACSFPAGGANAVVCDCATGDDVGVCTDLDCDTATARMRASCASACGDADPRVTCVEDQRECRQLGKPAGADLTSCVCDDDDVVSVCTVACNVDCDAACVDHGGGGAPQACRANAFECTIEERGPNALICDCEDTGTVAACSDLACDDTAAFHGACLDACRGANLAEARCLPSDQGCVEGAVPRGDARATCVCGDGGALDVCVASCAGVADNECAPRCADRGGVSSSSCLADQCR